AILDFRLAFGTTLPADCKIIQLEMDNILVGQNRASHVALVGNLACTFDAMMRVMDEEAISLDFSEYAAELRTVEDTMAQKHNAEAASEAVPIKAARLCQEIAKIVTDDMIVIGDGGDIVA